MSIKVLLPTSVGVILLGAFSVIFSGSIFAFFKASGESATLLPFFAVGFFFLLFGLTYYIGLVTGLPSFVLAIALGVATKPLLNGLIPSVETLDFIVKFGATYILFSGGLDISLSSFRKLFSKIISISFLGLLFTSATFSLGLLLLNRVFNAHLSVEAIVLLGAVLGSTDPAAIVPVLKGIRFKNRAIKDLVISESAVNDVTGTLLTTAFLYAIAAGVNYGTVGEYYFGLLSADNGVFLVKELGFGIFFGTIGFGLLKYFQKFKKYNIHETEADSAVFLSIPALIFSCALVLQGNGFLAAFIAGLFFKLNHHLHETEKFFNHLIEVYFKPAIFILLGSLVNISSLFEYAWIGISMSFVYMLIIRPLTVFVSLGGFCLTKNKAKMSIRELLFVSCIRETGAIPAVLLTVVIGSGIAGMEGLVEIGMWVILSTLVLQPVFTPWIVKKLDMGEVMGDIVPISLDKPTAILVTRGKSYKQRLGFVVKWLSSHDVKDLMLLICLEQKYNDDVSTEIIKDAEKYYKKIEEEYNEKGLSAPSLTAVSRKGLLEKNLETLSKDNHNISVVFVGKRMLDHRLRQAKKMHLPLYFID